MRWKVIILKRLYYDGLIAIKRRSLKRHICEEMKIITCGLNKYPPIERAFKEYDLSWTTKGGDTFCPMLVREFYANYQATLDNMCKKGEKDTDMPNIDQILVRG